MSKIEKLEYKGIRYLLYYPKNYEVGKKYPIMFHLHGAGSRGTDFKEFEGSLILEILNRGDSPLSNGFCVFPQCSTDNWFDKFSELLELVKHIFNQDFVDQKRFNASGISMGGYGIYQVMECLPELFNKAIVCCGGGMYWNSGRLKNIKFRIFHGELDTAVYPEEARRMYARLKETLADASLTIYPDVAHNCWDYAYTDYDNLDWLFKE